VFCACEIIQLFSVVLCVVRSVHNFEIWLFTKETLKIRYQTKEGHAVKETYAFDRLYMFGQKCRR
jgi:ribosomal protein L20A (L18A)